MIVGRVLLQVIILQLKFIHAFHWWLPEPNTQQTINDGEKNFGTSYLGDWHTYKIIWTPYEVRFYIDGNETWARSKYYFGSGDGWRNDVFAKDIQAGISYKVHEWFPRHICETVLQMQLNNIIVGRESSLLPAVFEVDYVTVREFFLSPEITCPVVVCSTETATLDVDPEASNITWTLSPGAYFSGATSGTGKTVVITPSGNYNGTGKIKFNFSMPSGETFSAEKTFGVRGPRYEDITFNVLKSDGTPANQISGTWLMCPNTTYHIYVNNDNSSCSTSGYSWSVPSNWTQFYTYQNMISINTNSSPGGTISVNANTCCNNFVNIIMGYMGTDYNCGYYSMSFSPNPTTGETMLILESNSAEKAFDETARWDLEIFSETQVLKTRQTGLRGRNAKIQTTGWQEGVYLVRVIYSGEVLKGKLIVKKQ